MSIATRGRVVGVDVGVGIDPNHIQVLVLLEGGEDRGAGDGMVSAEQEWSVQLVARLVEFEVTRSGVELLVLHHIWLRIAEVAEDVVVEVKTALVDTLLPLTLTAHAENRPEFLKFLHYS